MIMGPYKDAIVRWITAVRILVSAIARRVLAGGIVRRVSVMDGFGGGGVQRII